MRYAERFFSLPEIWEIEEIDSAEIPFYESVVDACRANRCGMYGKTWTCPPGVGELSSLEKKVKNYRTAVVFSCKYDLEDSFDFEGMTEGQKKTKAVLRGILAKIKEAGLPAFALGCEGCGICQECTYPSAPCRHPDLAVPSVEAYGISVVDLTKKIGMHYINGANTVTFFCIVLFDPQA